MQLIFKFDKTGGDKITQKGGKVKSCTPGKTFACGNACFTIGRNCKKNVDIETKEKTKKLANQLADKPLETKESNKGEIDQPTKKSVQPKSGQQADKIVKNQSEKEIDIPPKEIFNFEVSNKLDLPRTSISRINGLLQEYASGELEPEYLFKDDIFLTHLSSANSERDKSELGKQYGESADKFALKAWGELSDDLKKQSALDQDPEALNLHIKRSKSKTVKKIAEDMLEYHKKEQEKEKEKEREYLKKKAANKTSKPSLNELDDF